MLFLWFYVQELSKAQPAVVLVLKRLRRRGNYFVGSVLCPNCLQRLSADETSKQRVNYPCAIQSEFVRCI